MQQMYEITVDQIVAMLRAEEDAGELRVRIKQTRDGVIRKATVETDEHGKKFMVITDAP